MVGFFADEREPSVDYIRGGNEDMGHELSPKNFFKYAFVFIHTSFAHFGGEFLN